MYHKKGLALFIASFLIIALAIAPVFTACSGGTTAPSTSSSTPPSSSTQAPVELSLASLFPPTSIPALQLDRWVESVKTASNGSLTIRHFAGNTLLSPPDMMKGVAAGSADIGAGFYYVPEPGREVLAVISQLIWGYDYQKSVSIFNDYWSKYPDVMAKQWNGYKFLWAIPIHPNVIFTTDKKVEKMEDLKGLQLRVGTSQQADIMKYLGATPVSMSTADWVISLDKHTTDGGATSLGSLKDNGIGGEKMKYCTMFGTGPGVFFVIMNQDSWNKLSPQMQQAVDGTLEAARQDDVKTWSDYESVCIQYDKDTGMQFTYLTPDEYDRWNTTIKPVFDKIESDLNAAGWPGTELLQFCHDEYTKYYSQ